MTLKKTKKVSLVLLGVVIACGIGVMSLEMKPNSKNQANGFSAEIKVTGAQAGSRKNASKKNERDCKNWCAAHENCKKCSTKRGCSSGYKNLKTWGGKGKNWHACGKNKFGEESDKNKKACKEWCSKHDDCVKCSTLNGCGFEYKSIKDWRGKGKNWHACKPLYFEKDQICGLTHPLGCSNPWPSGLATASLVPMWNKRFHDACVRHDYCYRFGKSTYGKKREDCDNDFKNDMIKICKNEFKADGNCIRNAGLYFTGVRVGGGGNWDEYRKTGYPKCMYPNRMTTRAERDKKVTQ